MTVQELMIDDVVREIGDETTIRVDKISKNAIRDADDKIFFFDEIDPIPLTEEILKTNDFRYGLSTDQEDLLACGIGEPCETHNSLVWENENGGVVSINFPTESDGGQLYCHNDHKNECIDMSYSWLETIYIHQLQHILRLCGLEELADNFKVE